MKKSQLDSMKTPVISGVQPKPSSSTSSRSVRGPVPAEPSARWELDGDWGVRIENSPWGERRLEIRPPQAIHVHDEHAPGGLPEPQSPTPDGWLRGLPLSGVRAEECTIPGALLPGSLVVKDAPGTTGTVLVRGRDYDFDSEWGTIWRLGEGKLPAGRDVWFDYAHVPQRLDSAVATAHGEVVLREGRPHAAMPVPPPLAPGEERLANFHLPGPMDRLSRHHLFPILETTYPEKPVSGLCPAEQCFPQTMAKLRSGETIKILTWGDSVTEVGRYQPLLLAGLRARFPKADIQLLAEAWPGKTTVDYLNQPAGGAHSFEEKVLAVRPDLILSEFVNDASLREEIHVTRSRYERIRKAFQGIGAEWGVMTPPYVKPDWMGLDRQRDIDEDPRPYVRFLREFAREHGLAVADAAGRFGRLWRQGIPYLTLMENGINHPNPAGHQILADSLLALFPRDSR